MRVEVVLAGAGEDGGVAHPVLGILPRLVGVQGDDADRADSAGA